MLRVVFSQWVCVCVCDCQSEEREGDSVQRGRERGEAVAELGGRGMEEEDRYLKG